MTDTGSLMAQSKVPERGFILGTPLKVYHFLAPTVEEKNVWFQELQSRIFTQKRLFNEVRVAPLIRIPETRPPAPVFRTL